MSDSVNPSTEQVVTVDIASPTNVIGPGVIVQGGLTPSITVAEGVGELEIRLDASVVSSYPDGIENLDFTLTYSTDEFGVIEDSQVTFPGASIGLPNASVAGEIVASAIYFPTALGAEEVLMRVTFNQPDGVETSTIELTNVVVGTSDLASSKHVIGDPAVITGTSVSEAFILQGGNVSVTGGAGADVFALTQATGSSTTINDFVSGEDTIDLSDLAAAYGYQNGASGAASPTDGALARYAGDLTGISALIAENNAALDNTFGSFLDDETNNLTVFVDSSSDSGSITIESFEITLPDGVAVEDADITAVSYSFIA